MTKDIGDLSYGTLREYWYSAYMNNSRNRVFPIDITSFDNGRKRKPETAVRRGYMRHEAKKNGRSMPIFAIDLMDSRVRESS